MATHLVQLKCDWSESNQLVRCNISRCAAKRLFAFLLSNWFSHVSFDCVIRCLPNASRYISRIEILLYAVCPRSEWLKINSLRHPRKSLPAMRWHVCSHFASFLLDSYLTHVKCRLDTSRGAEFKNQELACRFTFPRHVLLAGFAGSRLPLSPMTAIPYPNKRACSQGNPVIVKG